MRHSFLLLTFSGALWAQAPVDTTFLRDHAQTRGFMLGRPVRPRPTPDGKAVVFLRAEPRRAQMNLFEFDVATGKTRELLTPQKLLQGAEENLTPEEKARRERQRVTVGGFTTFQLSQDGKALLVSLSGRIYVVERATGKIQELKTSPGTLVDPKFSPDGAAVSYVLGHDLYVFHLASQKERRITQGGTEKKSHALAEFVAQEEMGRFTGYWWSPDNRYLAYQENDASGVETWYVADPIHPDQPGHAGFYPRPGKANVVVRLGVVPVEGGETVWVEWDAKQFPYLTNVHWQEGGGLTLAVQNRVQQTLELLRADPATGKTTTLLTEHDPAWLNLNHDRPHWLDDGSFLWVGEGREGLQLEHRERTGALRRVLVPVAERFLDLIEVDRARGEVYYRASDNPTEQHLFRKPLRGGKPEALSRGAGLHSAVVSKNGAVYVHTASLLEAMPATRVHRHDGAVLGELPSVAETPPWVPRQEILQVGKAPGFYATLLRPRTFQPGARYPVIVHVYGGPGHQEVLAQMTRRLIDQWLADQGFLVCAVDNRGTPGRGRDWERAVYKKFGSIPLEDQVAGLRALAEKVPEMDLKRVGIYGWSFGGYMAAQAVLHRPDVYRCAVAGAPVTEWLDYDTHYTERYLGVPGNNDPVYQDASLLPLAAGLKRPLLLVHGTADDNVFFRHTLRLANALFREGREFEVLPLSGLTHLVPDAVVNQRLYGRFASYFQKHLGKPVLSSGDKR
ncbi:MAG: DPP IV N-terminal domain-containing protein [Gemmataceae bacterium]